MSGKIETDSRERNTAGGQPERSRDKGGGRGSKGAREHER